MTVPGNCSANIRGTLLDHCMDGGERCLACDGACCRSFSDVELSMEELERLHSLGAKRLHFSMFGRPRLVIDYNCEFLVDGKCSIYERRPDICRRFICNDPTG